MGGWMVGGRDACMYKELPHYATDSNMHNKEARWLPSCTYL